MSIILKDAAAADVVFNQISDSSSEAKYLASTSTLREPVYLVRKATIQEPGSARADRFLIQFTNGKFDSAGAFGNVKINLTIEAPRIGPDSQDVGDTIAFVKSFLGDTDLVAATLRGNVA